MKTYHLRTLRFLLWMEGIVLLSLLGGFLFSEYVKEYIFLLPFLGSLCVFLVIMMSISLYKGYKNEYFLPSYAFGFFVSAFIPFGGMVSCYVLDTLIEGWIR